MFSFALFTKLALLATITLTLMLGQPAYAQTQKTPSGTGKTLSATLLGQPHVSEVEASPHFTE